MGSWNPIYLASNNINPNLSRPIADRVGLRHRPMPCSGLIGFCEKLSCERGNLSILRTDGSHIEKQCETKQTKHYRSQPSKTLSQPPRKVKGKEYQKDIRA